MLAENFGNDWLQIDLPFACEIHHCYPRAQPDPRRFRVLSLVAEPAPLRWNVEHVRKNHQFFDLILTSDERLMDLPNTHFLIFGDAWTTEVPARKDFSISFLRSAGVEADWDGYAMRAKLWHVRDQVTIPTRYWYSQRRPPKDVEATDIRYPADSKDLLFESMYSVIVENIREKHYFTEKILDAFQTYTVPVYFGCPNIEHYFDPRGTILFEDESEFLGRINNLTPRDYWDRMPYIEANRKASMTFKNGFARLKQAILDGYARWAESSTLRA